MVATSYRAAWLPFPGDSTWDTGIETAVEWVLAAAAEEGAEPLLVTPQKIQQQAGPQLIRDFAASYPTTTPRGSMRGRGRAGKGPVLVYAPDYQMMDMAFGFAAGSVLAVIEAPPYELRGWAVEGGALDLSTGEVTPDSRSEQLRKALNDIRFAGNNGWADKPGSRDALNILRLLPANDRDKTMILGYMVAHDFGKDAVERLAVLIDRV